MATAAKPLVPIPGLEAVGHGIYVRPDQPYQVKDVLFERKGTRPYYSQETDHTYAVPETYAVDSAPPMPSSQALNRTLLEESWERFEKLTSLDTSLTIGTTPFSLDVTMNQSSQLRTEEDSYYAMRTSFVPLWSIYIPTAYGFSDKDLGADIPVPFSHTNRRAYEQFFERYGTHYVKRAWVGGKASLVFTISKSSSMTEDEIRAGLKASLPGIGGGSLDASDKRTREKLQENSRCTVLGQGGNQFQLAALSSLDDAAYNAWLDTVKENPEMIEFEAVGIWTLLDDAAKGQALMDAYKEETVFSPLRVVFNLDYRIYFLADEYFSTYDLVNREATKPHRIRDKWPELFTVGFERVDAAFLGKYLVSSAGEDLSRKLFLFNRDKYVRWDVDKSIIDPGYPRQIADGWPGVTFERIDSALNVAPDALYFFKGNQYIRFNTLLNKADSGYPDLVSRRWVGVTFDRIDAAVYWGNGQVYFFRDNQYIRYDTVTWRADPGYPKSIASNYVEDWRFFE